MPIKRFFPEQKKPANLWKCNEANTQHFPRSPTNVYSVNARPLSFDMDAALPKPLWRRHFIINRCPGCRFKRSAGGRRNKKTNPMSANKQQKVIYDFIRQENVSMPLFCRWISLIYFCFKQNKFPFRFMPFCRHYNESLSSAASFLKRVMSRNWFFSVSL